MFGRFLRIFAFFCSLLQRWTWTLPWTTIGAEGWARWRSQSPSEPGENEGKTIKDNQKGMNIFLCWIFFWELSRAWWGDLKCVSCLYCLHMHFFRLLFSTCPLLCWNQTKTQWNLFAGSADVTIVSSAGFHQKPRLMLFENKDTLLRWILQTN